MPAYVTAVDILVPDPITRVIDPYRRLHARHLFARVPAHITLSCPFVPFDRLQTAHETLTSVCADTAPFSLTVAGSGTLPDPSRLVLLLEPEEQIRELQMLLLARFPEAGAEGLPARLVRPHITVGYVDDAVTMRRLSAELDQRAGGLTFGVHAAHTSYGNETCVWRVHCRYPLGGPAS